MNKMREYERGREDGLDLALRIVKDGKRNQISWCVGRTYIPCI